MALPVSTASRSNVQLAERASPKLAQQVAMRIEEDIVGSGWRVGARIGSEAELTTRYGVSRWVLREAIQIAEQDGLVQIRRGRAGGIVVSAPVLAVVGSSIRRYLCVSRISATELCEARRVLEGLAARLAHQRVDKDRIRTLRALADRASAVPKGERLPAIFAILRELLCVAGNATLEVFVHALSQATVELALFRGIGEAELGRVADRLLAARVALVEAILAGDMAAADDEIATFLDLGIHSVLNAARRPNRPRPPVARDLPGLGPRTAAARPKLPEEIAWRIEADLATHDWAPGRLLGSEAELMQRYGASRSVIREAIRPLERLGAVTMCRGANSGLKVAQPDPAPVVRSVVLYLDYSRNDDFVSYELRRQIELAVLAQLVGAPAAVRRGVAEELQRFARLRFSPSLASLRKVVHDLGQLFAAHAENRVFSFFLRILAETVLRSSRCTLAPTDAAAVIRAVQRKALQLGEAIENGAVEDARRRIEEIWNALREAYDLPKKTMQRRLAA